MSSILRTYVPLRSMTTLPLRTVQHQHVTPLNPARSGGIIDNASHDNPRSLLSLSRETKPIAYHPPKPSTAALTAGIITINTSRVVKIQAQATRASGSEADRSELAFLPPPPTAVSLSLERSMTSRYPPYSGPGDLNLRALTAPNCRGFFLPLECGENCFRIWDYDLLASLLNFGQAQSICSFSIAVRILSKAPINTTRHTVPRSSPLDEQGGLDFMRAPTTFQERLACGDE
ncbi:hypothetical protein CVT26_004407, partial [Gymnopilus dilepis]